MAHNYEYFERTAGTDYNNAADFNQLNENIAAVISTSGTAAPATPLDQKFNSSDVLNTSSTATDKVFSAAYVTDNFSTGGGGGGAGGPFEVGIPAGSWDLPASDFAEPEKDTGTNGTITGHLFDDTTEEFVEGVFVLPSAIAGTVTFEAYGYPTTWVTGKNIELKFYHSAKADDENWDAAYSNKESGDLAINTSGQDVLDRFTFTESISTLGWTANDQVRIKLSRIAPSANNLSGDWRLTHFRVIVPRA